MPAATTTIPLPTLISSFGASRRRVLSLAHVRGWTLGAFASEEEEARDCITVEQALEVSDADPGLVVAVSPLWLVEGAPVVADDGDLGRIESINWGDATAFIAWDQGISTVVSLLEVDAS